MSIKAIVLYIGTEILECKKMISTRLEETKDFCEEY
jgi:hypothetical protein